MDKFATKKRFAFVDGLSGLFLSRQSKPATGRADEKVLVNPSPAAVSGEIHAAVRTLKTSHGGKKVMLVIDQLDFLLAAGGDGIGAVCLGEMLLGLREVRPGHVSRISERAVLSRA